MAGILNLLIMSEEQPGDSDIQSFIRRQTKAG